MIERPAKILVSAGEASGDRYAAALVRELQKRLPDAQFFGCTGHEMRNAGVRTVVDSASLAVVGLIEVIGHLPRIYGEFRRLSVSVDSEEPDLAILTDSPDFHFRLLPKLKKAGVPIVYLVAPQVWAWRKGRIPFMRRMIDHLLCIFPFEEAFFREHGITATYIGHPLSALIRPGSSKQEFLGRHGLDPGRPMVALLPGSRRGEALRHVPDLLDAAGRIRAKVPVNFVLGTPSGRFSGEALHAFTFFRERNRSLSIKVIEGETQDILAHADLALAASGTVTVEAALLGTPMVTFYKVTALSWAMGKFLVRVPFYSMVNLVAGRPVAPELMQNEMSGERLAAEALRLLEDPAAREQMRRDLESVAARLSSVRNPMEVAAGIVLQFLAAKSR